MVFLLTSCYSNMIYFDMDSQSIVRCDGKISRLYIESEDGKELWHFSVLPKKEPSKFFSIREINKNYSVKILYSSGHIDLENFKLRPEIEYKVTNSSSYDAAAGELLLKTDSNGYVIYADRTSCN